jgi:hypothetical protein
MSCVSYIPRVLFCSVLPFAIGIFWRDSACHQHSLLVQYGLVPPACCKLQLLIPQQLSYKAAFFDSRVSAPSWSNAPLVYQSRFAHSCPSLKAPIASGN